MQETKHHSKYTLPYDIKTVPQFKINVIFMQEMEVQIMGYPIFYVDLGVSVP